MRSYRLLSAFLVSILSSAPAWAQNVNADTLTLQTASGNCIVRAGTSVPEGAVTGNPCDVFVRQGTGDVYVKSSGTGNSGWSLIVKGDSTHVISSSAFDVTTTAAATLTSNDPQLKLFESDASSDERLWRFAAAGGDLTLAALNNAGSSGTDILRIARTGTTVDTITFPSGNLAIAGTTSVSRNLFGQGLPTNVTNFIETARDNIPTGRYYNTVVQTYGLNTSDTDGDKVALYAAAETGTSASGVLAGNFVGIWRSGDTASLGASGVEIDLNNENVDQSLHDPKFIYGLNIMSGGAKHIRTAMHIGAQSTGKWKKVMEFGEGVVTDIGFEMNGPTPGLTGLIVGRQITNGGDTILLQRKTDTSPTGYFLRTINAANNTNYFTVDVAGNTAVGGALSVNGGERWNQVNAGTITADQNNWNPTGLSSARILGVASDATRNITGIAGGVNGQVLLLVNTGGNPIVLKNQNGGSSAGNRFQCPNSADYTLGVGFSVQIYYDGTASVWRLIVES